MRTKVLFAALTLALVATACGGGGGGGGGGSRELIIEEPWGSIARVTGLALYPQSGPMSVPFNNMDYAPFTGAPLPPAPWDTDLSMYPLGEGQSRAFAPDVPPGLYAMLATYEYGDWTKWYPDVLLGDGEPQTYSVEVD